MSEPLNYVELAALLARARAAFEALPPDQQIHHRHEQRIDFAAGNVALSWPEPPEGKEPNIDKARRLIREGVGPCPCGSCAEAALASAPAEAVADAADQQQ